MGRRQCWSAVGPNPCDFVEPEAHAHENCELVCEGTTTDSKSAWRFAGAIRRRRVLVSRRPHPCDSGRIRSSSPTTPPRVGREQALGRHGNKWSETYGAENDAGVFEPVADAAEAVTEGVEDAAEAGDGVEAAGEAVSDGVEATGDAMRTSARASRTSSPISATTSRDRRRRHPRRRPR